MMDARVLLLASTLALFGEGGTSGSNPTSNVRIFMKIEGEVQGPIIGEATLPSGSKDKAIEVVRMTEAIYTPVDPVTGLPSGQRRYEGLVVRKPMDKTTPQIGDALAHQEELEEVELLVYIENRTTRILELRFRHTLENATVVRIDRDLYGTSTSSGEMVPRPEEEVMFRFRRFRFEDVVHGIQYNDEVGVVFSTPPDREPAIGDSPATVTDGQAQTPESTMD
jgi:type VI secretion system Hcp family effector